MWKLKLIWHSTEHLESRKISSLGDEGWKTLTVGHCFQVFSTIQGFSTIQLQVSTIPVITLMCQASTCSRVRAPGLTPSAPIQWKLDVHVTRFVSARSPLTKPRKRECSNIKSTRVRALTGSVPHNMAEQQQRVLAPCGNRTQVTRLSAAHSRQCTKKTVY